jgi:hypothetical protein
MRTAALSVPPALSGPLIGGCSVGGGLVAVFAPELLLLAVAGLAGALVVMYRPVWVAMGCIAGIFLLDFAAWLGLIPTRATWLPEAAVLVLAARLALLRLGRPMAFRGVSGFFDLAVLILVIAAAVSGVAGNEHPMTTVLGLRAWLILLVLLYVILNDDDLLAARGRLWWAFWILLALQPLPVYIEWYLSSCRNCYVDTYYGTLMSTATLAIAGAMAAACALAFYLEQGRVLWLAVLVPMLIAFGLADAKGGFAMVAGAMAAVLGYRLAAGGWLRSKARLVAALVVAPALLLAGVEAATRNLDLNVSELVFNPRALTEYAVPDDATGQNINRAFDLNLALRASAEQDQTWVGAGPGAASESSLPQFTGSVYRTYANRIGRSAFWVQGGRLLVELGLLGVLATAGLAAALLLLARQGYRRATTSFERAIALSLVGQVAVFLMAHFYQTIHDVPRLGLWLSAAVVAGDLPATGPRTANAPPAPETDADRRV